MIDLLAANGVILTGILRWAIAIVGLAGWTAVVFVLGCLLGANGTAAKIPFIGPFFKT